MDCDETSDTLGPICILLNFWHVLLFRDDLLRAIKKLKILGNGFTVIPMGKTYMIQSVPGELSMDHTTVIQQAQVCTCTYFTVWALVLQNVRTVTGYPCCMTVP